MAAVRILPTVAQRANRLLHAVQYTHRRDCPCHSNTSGYSNSELSFSGYGRRSLATPRGGISQKEYAFEMASSSIRFGEGCTMEVGMDMKNLGARKLLVVTDKNVARLGPLTRVVQALDSEAIDYVVYDETMVEPKDSSLE